MARASQKVPIESQPLPNPPWSRMEGEGGGDLERLDFYCSLGPDRCHRDVAQKFGVSEKTIRNTASRWRWSERASAWDGERSRRASEAALSEAEDVAREHARRWQVIGDLALKAFESANPEQLSLRDALAMMDRATHYQRLAIGEATERVEVREHLDTSRLTDEQLAQLHRLLAICRGEG